MLIFLLQKPKGVTHCPSLLLEKNFWHEFCVCCSAQLSRAGHIQNSRRNSWRYSQVRLCYPGTWSECHQHSVAVGEAEQVTAFEREEVEGFPQNIWFCSFSFYSPSMNGWRYHITEILKRKSAALIPSAEAMLLLWCWRQSFGCRFWTTLHWAGGSQGSTAAPLLKTLTDCLMLENEPHFLLCLSWKHQFFWMW